MDVTSGRKTQIMFHSLLATILLTSASLAFADPIAVKPTAVRPLCDWIAQVIDGARPLSPTLDRHLLQVAALPLIVYVDELTKQDADYDGRLSFIGAAGGYRFLRIELRQLSAPAVGAVLAHELRHVLEVAASDVTTRAEFDALYERIGTQLPGGDGRRYDTLAAVAVGQDAMRELTSAARTARGR